MLDLVLLCVVTFSGYYLFVSGKTESKSPFSKSQIDLELKYFFRLWCKHFPVNYLKVRLILNTLNIVFTDVKPEGHVGQAISPYRLLIWSGIKVNNTYNIKNTAFLYLLLQILHYRLFNHEISIEDIGLKYKNLILEWNNSDTRQN